MTESNIVAFREGTRALESAFAPCDLPGLAEAWVECNRIIADANKLIAATRKERAPIEQALMGLMLKSGEVIEGEGYRLRLVWTYTDYDFQKRTAERVPGIEMEWLT